MTTCPELEPHCGSWVVTTSWGEVFEFFERANAQKAVDRGWRVETAMTYLARINREVRHGK